MDSSLPVIYQAPALPPAREAIAYHLRELLSHLDRVRQNGLPPAVNTDPSWWSDDQYVYLEMGPFHGAAAPALDLSVCNGTTFVRIER